MISKNERSAMAGRMAVKQSLIEDGWMVLFENTDTEDPVDIRAVKGVDRILVHIISRSDDPSETDEMKHKLLDLKRKADETNAYAFTADVRMSGIDTPGKVRFTQLT